MSGNRIKIDVNKEAVYTGHRDCVYVLASNLNNNTFFSSGSDGLIVNWDIDNPDLGKVTAKVNNTVYAICHIPDTEFLIIGQNFEGIHLIDLTQQRITKSAKISDTAIFDIQFLANRIYVATGDGTIVVVNLEDFTTLARFKHSTSHARTLAINPSKSELVVGYSDNYIRLFDVNTYQLKKEWEGHTNSVFTLQYNFDYRFLLSGSRDAHLKIWDTENNYAIHESIVAHMYTINHIAFNESGDFFATCSKDKSIKVWETKTFKLIKVIDKARHAGHGTSVNKLFWVGNDRLFSCSDDRSISQWSLKFNFPEDYKL